MGRARIEFRQRNHFLGVEYAPGDVVAEIELPGTLTANRLDSYLRNGIAVVVPVEDAKTSATVASTAGRVLADDDSSEDAKSVAGSALAQTPPARGKRKGR